jgi:spore germination protein KC
MFILPPGCTAEIQDLAIVRSMGLDLLPNGEIEITVSIVNPGAEQSGSQFTVSPISTSVAIMSQTGKNTVEAMRRLSFESSGRLYFSHCETLLLNRRLIAERSLGEILDLLERNYDFRPTLIPIITDDSIARLFAVPSPLDPSPADRINRLIREQHLYSQFPRKNLIALIRSLQTPGQDPYLPELCQEPNPSAAAISDQEAAHGNLAIPNTKLRLCGTTIFSNDRPVASLNPDQTKALLMMLGEAQHSIIIQFPSPVDGADVSLDIFRVHNALDVELFAGKPSYTISMELHARLMELHGRLDPTDPLQYAALEEAGANHVRELARQTVDICLLHSSDVLSFGRSLERKNPQQWQRLSSNWQTILPTLPVKIAVRVHLVGTGFTTSNPNQIPYEFNR